MSTALTEYFSALTASSTISTANVMLPNAATGAALTNKNTNLTSGTLGWLMMYSQGIVTAQTGAGSELSPNAVGWIDDSTTLEGQQFIAGNWVFSIPFETTTTGTYTANIHFRAFRLTPSGPTYTLIAEAIVSAQGIISTAYTTVTGTITAVASPAFAVGDKLYCDCQHDATVNGTTGNMRMQGSNTLNTGSTSAQLVTPGFQPFVSKSSISDGGYGGVFV